MSLWFPFNPTKTRRTPKKKTRIHISVVCFLCRETRPRDSHTFGLPRARLLANPGTVASSPSKARSLKGWTFPFLVLGGPLLVGICRETLRKPWPCLGGRCLFYPSESLRPLCAVGKSRRWSCCRMKNKGNSPRGVSKGDPCAALNQAQKPRLHGPLRP